jgi:flagellar hook-basal body complex protein FliE
MTVINPLQSAALSPSADLVRPAPQAPGGSGFVNLIDDLLGKVNQQQAGADLAVRDLAAGQTDNLHGVMLAVAKADLSFRLFLEIRNRLTDAFQEIMRMQV